MKQEEHPHDTCWFCRNRNAVVTNTLSVHMYSEPVSNRNFKYKGPERSFSVPIHDANGTVVGRSCFTQGGPPAMEDLLNPKCTWREMTINVPRCSRCRILWAGSYFRKRKFPQIRNLLADGWRIGDEPSDDEIAKAHGFETKNERQLKQFYASLTIVALVGLVWLIAAIADWISK